MVKDKQLSVVLRRAHLRYGFGAVCLGVAALLFLLSFRGGAAQGLTAPLTPAVPVMSSETSIVATNNTVGQAVAGELVTVTAVFNVPAGDLIYNASPRVVLQDGLYPLGASHAYTLYTGTVNELRAIEGSGNIVAYSGALIVFANQGTITGTDVLTMTVYAVRRQQNYVGTPADIANGANLRVQGILRYCTTAPDCVPTLVVNTPANATPGQVTAIQPLVNTSYASSYLDAAQLGEGGGQVRLTFTAAAATGRPTAYDIVYTATLGSGLTYADSNGTGVGAGNVTVVGETTYVTWTVPGSMVAPQTWQAVVTATLPNTFTVGREFTYFGTAAYETFAGDVQDEGRYTTSGTVQTLRPGVSITTKTSVPSSGAVTMGDRITYTLTFRQAANTLLQAPYYVDTLPRGFHYVSGTLTLQGATLLGYAVLEGPVAGTGSAARYFENLRVNMDTLPVTGTLRQVTVSYTALNTGLDYRGVPVWESAANMQAANNTVEGNTTGAMLYWTPPSGFAYGNLGGNYANLTTKANSTNVTVIQPFLANAQFAALRDGTADVTVGDFVLFTIRLRNSGAAPGIPAYELQVCDTLPEGFAYVTTFSCSSIGGAPACPAFTSPQAGSTGKVCWAFDGLPRTGSTAQYHELKYQAQVLPTAVPGVYSNAVTVEGYSSQRGVVEGERDYSDFPQALISGNCGAACIRVTGLAADKQAWVDEVAPGALLTYTLWLTDTRNTTSYTGVVVTDTYDTLLSFVSADPPVSAHNIGARQLIWNVGTLSSGGSRQIVLTMRVAETIAERYILTNTMMWDSDQSLPFTVAETTAIAVPTLHLRMDGPQNTHAGQDIVYTVTYSNTGTAAAPVVLTLDYGSYVEFLSSTPLTPRTGSDNIFDDVVGPGGSRTLTINLRVKAPLPYDLAGPLTASALLESPGAESKHAQISMILERPVLVLEKTGPLVVQPVVGTIVEYTIRVQNLGTYTATGAVITDTWDANLGYRANNSSFGWALSGDGTYATQSLGTLGVGETVTKFFQVDIVTVAVSYTNRIDLTTYQTTQQSEIEDTWQASIATTKSATPVPAFPGRVLTYTVYYTSTATFFPMVNAFVTDTLPSNFVYLGQSTAQASGCQSPWTFTPPGSGGGGNAVWSCATLLANANGRFIIWGEVKAEAEGTNLTNRTTTSALNIPVRPIAKPLVTRVARPWLRVDKAVVPTYPVAPGNLLTYTLTYENYGTDPAYNVIIKDQLPEQVAYVSCSGGNSCGHSGGLVTWNIAQVPVGTVSSVQVVVAAKAGTGGQTAVNANYTIQSDRLAVADTITGSPVSSEIRDPHLAAEKLADPAYVTQTGDRITYTISLTNDGGGILHNVVITDAINVRTNVDRSTLPPECTVSGSPGVNEVVTCNIGAMAQGAVKVVQFKVYLAGAPTQGDFITNTAYSDSDETASAPSNTTTVWVTTGCIPPHNVDFTVSANPQAGQPVTFTASAAGDTPMTYSWAFGDMQTGSGQVVQHTYAVSGTYKVDLTVSNGCVAPVTVSKNVFVPGAPEITWTPSSFVKSAIEGSTTALQDTLTVSNTGTANLLWHVEVTPTTATWLKVAVAGGDPGTSILPQLTVPGNGTPVTVYFDPTGLTAGTYTAQLRIVSNDADESVVLVSVTFTIQAVEEEYYIYLPLVLRNS
ncbi:MAG: PKD domain-containing protein [Anaerolineae bacterium]